MLTRDDIDEWLVEVAESGPAYGLSEFHLERILALQAERQRLEAEVAGFKAMEAATRTERDAARALIESAREVGCVQPLPNSGFANTRALKAEGELLVAVRELDGLRTREKHLLADLESALKQEAVGVTREMYSVAFVSRDLVERAREVLDDQNLVIQDALRRGAMLLREALGR